MVPTTVTVPPPPMDKARVYMALTSARANRQTAPTVGPVVPLANSKRTGGSVVATMENVLESSEQSLPYLPIPDLAEHYRQDHQDGDCQQDNRTPDKYLEQPQCYIPDRAHRSPPVWPYGSSVTASLVPAVRRMFQSKLCGLTSVHTTMIKAETTNAIRAAANEETTK